MNTYVTGKIIKCLREEKGMTQVTLADRLGVSDKAVSKWETGKGYPDITLVETIAATLGVSAVELLSGDSVTNQNRSFNMKRCVFYVCPICGNVIFSTGEAVVCCHGINLPKAESEPTDVAHGMNVETVEDEYYVTLSHEMTKQHYISFIAAVRDNGVEVVKLYPEGAAEARFKRSRTVALYAYCNRHGLFLLKL